MSDANSPAGSPAPHREEDDAPQVNDGSEQPAPDDEDEADGDQSDKESDVLSDIDEDQFEDYDPETANIEDRPVEIDEDVAKTLKAARRKRADGENKKPKEGRREKKRARDDDDDLDFGDVDTTKKRARRAKGDGERAARKKKATPELEKEENLTPHERRMRALSRVMDDAVKQPKRRSKRKDEEDLENDIDDQMSSLKIQMERACEADNNARREGQPAVHKLKLLPEVVALLNRDDIKHFIVDPEVNFLGHVKFFLEPLDDGSLPAYNIQRDMFSALTRLPIQKETLLSSEIGKVVLFYTRSKRPEVSIKRMAERLLGEWSRPILKRTDDYKKRFIETRNYDYEAAKHAQRVAAGSQFTLSQRPAASSQAALDADRERALAPVVPANRARMVGLPQSYTVAPMSTYDKNMAQSGQHRPIGAAGAEAFRRMTTKNKRKGGA